MYKVRKPGKSLIARHEMELGERIEEKIARILTTNEPITDGAQAIYTDRKDGVIADCDIRTDKMEIATKALSDKANIAKRREVLDAKKAAEKAALEKAANPGNPES